MIGGLLARLRAKVAEAVDYSRRRLTRPKAIPSTPPRPAASAAPAPGRRRRRDPARQLAAQAKRERKDTKRRRDWCRSIFANNALGPDLATGWPFVAGEDTGGLLSMCAYGK